MRLCSKHFRHNDFVMNFGRETLKSGSIPSICTFPMQLKEKPVTRKSRTDIEISIIEETSLPSTSTVEIIRDNVMGSISQNQTPLRKRLIENYSEKSKRSCTEILFDEWGTSGRFRPTLGHLLYLLVKADLFKAADYVAIDILHQAKPKRPEGGPAKEITVDLDEIRRQEEDIEGLLDEIDYPTMAVNLIRKNSAKGAPAKTPKQIPQIVVTPDVDSKNDVSIFSTPLVVQKERDSEHRGDSVSSNMIEFSSDEVRVATDCPAVISSTGPNFSVIMESSKSNEASTKSEADIVPAFSQIIEVPENLPALSLLNLEDTSVDGSVCMPDFDALQGDNKNEVDEIIFSTSVQTISSNTSNTTSSWFSSDNSRRSSSTSPLPALNLNTELPHFNYSKLVSATNGFNEEQFTSENASGRFLGSGEFGSVFLALDLMDRRVAVKKLSLGGLEVVNVDDQVTKQFRNEVEVLSKYKHENLLTLLGFSCDGCTYCLLYEFIPGGALRDRLQVDGDILQWKQRLNIAVGTSKAISYLHIGFERPLIHRDIKSANILLDSRNNPKLCDFGLVKLIPNQNGSVATSVFGTSAYMPREAFGGDISVKLDTFSFGVVLLELITSLPPVDEKRDGADLVTHVSETVENDNILPMVDSRAGTWFERNVNYARGLYRIAMKCLEEKKNRPTMVEVKMALDELTKNIEIF